MEAVWVIVTAVVVIAVAQIGLTIAARKQIEVVVDASPQEVADVVQSHFKSVWWRQVGGGGDLNFQAKGVGMGSYGLENPVLSVQIDETGSGVVAVGIWMSEWESRFGIAGAADRAYFKRRKLVKKLESLRSVPV